MTQPVRHDGRVRSIEEILGDAKRRLENLGRLLRGLAHVCEESGSLLDELEGVLISHADKLERLQTGKRIKPRESN